jgi:hypothetical protein
MCCATFGERHDATCDQHRSCASSVNIQPVAGAQPIYLPLNLNVPAHALLTAWLVRWTRGAPQHVHRPAPNNAPNNHFVGWLLHWPRVYHVRLWVPGVPGPFVQYNVPFTKHIMLGMHWQWYIRTDQVFPPGHGIARLGVMRL